jgi:apolipoprotein D and lipocalin family protein
LNPVKIRSALLVLLLLPAAGDAAGAQSADEPHLVESVDLERMAGLWYEIARIPNRFQNDCSGAATAYYELRDDGRVDVINRCLKADGKVKESRGIARPAAGGRARLEFSPVSVLGWRPVWADY